MKWREMEYNFFVLKFLLVFINFAWKKYFFWKHLRISWNGERCNKKIKKSHSLSSTLKKLKMFFWKQLRMSWNGQKCNKKIMQPLTSKNFWLSFFINKPEKIFFFIFWKHLRMSWNGEKFNKKFNLFWQLISC